MKIDHFKDFIILISGILRDVKGNILLIKRSNKNKTFKGSWQLPEGKMEFGEQPIETLTREINEELGCRLISARLASVNSVVIPFQGISYHVLRIVLAVQWKGEITLSGEHEASRWTSIKEALKMPNLVEGTKEILLNLKRDCRK